MHYLYVAKFGYDEMGDINFVLYFGQQANTTAHYDDDDQWRIHKPKQLFFLPEFGKSEVSHGRQFHSEIKDVAAGRKPRFQTTGNAIFSETLIATNE